MNKHYAIFDMDGTLLDSMPFWVGLPQEYLDQVGAGPLRPGDGERIATMTLSGAAAFLVEQYHLRRTPQQAADELTALIGSHYRGDLQLKRQARSYLQQLRAQGVHMCVASATDQELIEVCFARLGILDWFDVVLSCETLHTDKLHPDIYLECARRMGAAPGDVAVFEDMSHALRTAKDAGFYTVAVHDPLEEYERPQLTALADETLSLD